jgi:hypothetical protein
MLKKTDEIKQDELGGTCSTDGRRTMQTKFWPEQVEKRGRNWPIWEDKIKWM